EVIETTRSGLLTEGVTARKRDALCSGRCPGARQPFDTLYPGSVDAIQAIPVAVDCEQAPPVLGCKKQLAANPTDVRVQRAGAYRVTRCPYCLAEMAAGQQATDVA